MDYEQKFLLFKKLIDETYSGYEKKYSVNFNNKTFVVKFILTDTNRLIKLTILPDSEWYYFKKEIEKCISSISFTECPICFYQKFYVEKCEKCSFTICSDCVSEIIFTDNMYSCPQCRYIPPHIVFPKIVTPRLTKLGSGIYAVTKNFPPCEDCVIMSAL